MLQTFGIIGLNRVIKVLFCSIIVSGEPRRRPSGVSSRPGAVPANASAFAAEPKHA